MFANYLDTGNITEGQIVSIQRISDMKSLPSRARRKVQAGDIVYSTVRPNQKHYGIIANPVKNMLVSTGFTVIRGMAGKCESKFLYYLLIQHKIIEYLQTIAEHSTSAYPSIRPADIESLVIGLPPLPEQRTIAHILGTLDDKIELNRKMNETLEAMARAIFKSWFIDFDPVRANTKGRDTALPKEIADLFPDSFEDSELGEIPKGWLVGTLGDACTVQGGFAYKSVDFSDIGHPVIKIKNITSNKDVNADDVDYLSEALAQKTKDFWLKDGDLIMAMTGATVGKYGLVVNPEGLPCVMNQRVCRFSPLANHGEKVWYIFCALARSEIIDQVISIADGSAQPNISAKGICSTELVVPQDELILRFNQQVSPIFELILNNKRKSRTLAALRDTLLPKLISGEILIKDAGTILEATI